MECVPKDKNNLGRYLNSIYVVTEQFRYGKTNRASTVSVSGKTKIPFKEVYEKTLDNIENIEKKLKDFENESKSLRLKNENLVVEKDNGSLKQLYENSQREHEVYKNKSKGLAQENLALKRKNEIYFDHLQDCLRKNEEYKKKAKDLLFSKQELEKRSQEQIQRALKENDNLNAELKTLEKENHGKLLELKKQFDAIREENFTLYNNYQKVKQDLEYQNNKSRDASEKKNEEIAQLKNPLMQSKRLKSKVEVDKGISAKLVLLSLQAEDNTAKKTHSNLLQSAADKQVCNNCRKLQFELKSKLEEINELRKDEADFKIAGFKRSSSLEYLSDSYLKENTELNSKNRELQGKNQELAKTLKSVQDDLYQYKNPYGKPTYADLWKLHEENKQQLDKSEEYIKITEMILRETQEKYSKLKEENEKRIKGRQKIQAEFEDIQTVLQKTQNDLIGYKQREEILKKTEAELRKVYEENNQKLTEKEISLKEIETNLKVTQEKYLLLQNDNEKLLKENEGDIRIKDLLKKTEASFKETQQNYLSLRENYDKLGKYSDGLIKEIKEIKTTLMQNEEREDRLKENEDNLKKTLNKMRQKYQNLQQDNEKLAKEIEELKKEIEENFVIRSKIEMELESVHKTFQETHCDLVQHKQKEEIIKKTESEINNLQEKFSNLEERNRQLIKLNDDYLEDLRQYRTKYEDIQRELKMVHDEFEEYKRIKKEEEGKEKQKRIEKDQVEANQFNESENVLKEKEEYLQKALSDLKHQNETLQNELVKINQRQTEIDERMKNVMEKEARIKEEETAYHKKEDNLKKIEEDFKRNKTELTVQVTNLNEKYIILQREKEETDKTYQHLLKQFVQTQEELKQNKTTLAKLEEKQIEEKRKYLEEKEILKQQHDLLETKLYKYEQSKEEILDEEELKLRAIKEECKETTRKQKKNIVVLHKESEEVLDVKKLNDPLVKEANNRNLDLEEKVANLMHQNQNLLRGKEQDHVQIAELGQTGQRLQKEIRNVKQKLEESEKLLKKKTNQTEKADEERKTAIEKCEDFERRLKSLSEEKEDSLKKMTRLQSQVSHLRDSNNLLLRAKEEIEHELISIQDVLKKKNELTEEVSELKIRIQNLLEERREYFDFKEEFLRKYNVLQKENEQITRKLKTIENVVQDGQGLKKELEKALNQNPDLNKELAKANRECSALKQEAENLRNHYEQKIRILEDDFKKEASELSNGNEKLEKETKNVIQHLEVQIQGKDAVILSKNKLIQEIETELKNKQKSEEEMRELLVRIEKSEEEFQAKENIFIKKEETWAFIKSDLTEQLLHTKQEITKIKQENEDLLQEYEALKLELKSVQDLHEQHRRKIEENFKNEGNNLKNELVSVKNNNKKLENRLNEVLQMNLILESEIKAIKTDLDQHKNAAVKPTYEELSTLLLQLEEQLKEKNGILEKEEGLLKAAKQKLKETDELVEKTKTELRLKEEEFNTKINEGTKSEKEFQENALILKQENAKLKGKVSQTAQENENLRQECELLKQELETKRNAYENQSRKNEENFKQEMHNVNKDISSLKDLNKKLKDDLNDALQKKSKLEEEFQIITNELDRYKNPKTKPTYEELSKHLAQLEAQSKEKSSTLENKYQLMEQVEIQTKNKEVEFTERLMEISNIKTIENDAIIESIKTEYENKIESYITIQNNLKENISILERENANNMEKVTKINQECNELRQEQEILKRELDNKKNLYEQQLQKLEEISEKETNDLRNDISSLKSKNQKLENDIKTSADKCLRLENELHRYKNPTIKPSYEQLEEELKEKDAVLQEREKIIKEREKRDDVESALRAEIFKLKETNATLTKERDAAIRERAKILEECESVKRELEGREIVYEEELNRYEETFRKEEKDLRSRVSVLKRENGVLQRKVDNVLEEKHRIEELTRTTQNNLIKEMGQLEKQLQEKNAALGAANTLIKDLKKQANEFERLLSVKEDGNRKLEQQIQQLNEFLRTQEEFKHKMGTFRNEVREEKVLLLEKNKILDDEAPLAQSRSKENIAGLKDYYENEILILKQNLDATVKQKEEIGKERDDLLLQQQKIGSIHSPFDERNSILTKEVEEKERKISVLKCVNESYSKDMEIMKKEMEMLRQKYQDIKAAVERDEVKVQLEGKVENPTYKNVSSTIASFGFFEELATKTNTDDLKKIHDDVKKETMQTYGKKVRSLDIAILKLINELDDAEIRKQNKEFKKQLKLKSDEIERIESVFTFSDTITKIKSYFEETVGQIMNGTQKNLDQFKQVFSADGTINPRMIISQINEKYDEMIVMLSEELNRLQMIQNIIRNDVSDMPKETSIDEEDPPSVRESLKMINEINQNIRQLEIRAVKFRGNKDDKTYLDLNYKMLENIMKLDVIQVNGSQKVRERRKEAIKYANSCMEKLDSNLES